MASPCEEPPDVLCHASQRPGDIIDHMSRRTTSMVVSAVLLVALVTVAFSVPMPYVLQSPGVTENTLGKFDGKPIIDIDGAKTYPVSGHLELTTVTISRQDYQPRLPDVLSSWVASDEVVIPRDAYYPPDQTAEEVEEQNEADMLDSQSAAIAAGLTQAGINPYVVKVADVVPGAPAEGVIEKGDRIRSVDGEPVGTAQELVDAVSGVEPGSEVVLRIERGEQSKQVRVVTEANPESPDTSRIGVSAAGEPVFDPPIDVTIKLGQDIGGPSAGLVFSLAIYDMLTPGALTGGRFVAGTGTLDAEGNVGPIGGIRQKIVGAYKDGEGASVFLVPADNCEEAGGSDLKDELLLVKVATVDEAVSALNSIESGDESALTLCGR